MSRFKSVLGNTMAVLYFILVMLWIILLLPIVVIFLFTDIHTIIISGFSSVNVGLTYIGIFGLFIGLSLLILPFRKIYYKLNWLFPYVKILYIDVTIMSLATIILNYGYEVQSNTRHLIFLGLMIIQIIVCRLVMCIYFNKKPVKFIGGVNNE